MAKKISPMDVYKLLPRLNCGRCGISTCLGFAAKLVERAARLEECTPLFEEERYRDNLSQLREVLRPPVLEVAFGPPGREVRVGGKLVLHRHELRYMNPTVLAVDVWDDIEGDLESRVKLVDSLSYTYIGRELKLNALALRCRSGDPSRFQDLAEKVSKLTDLPIILCSLDPEALEAALLKVGDRRPLIYAATEDNWRDLSELAKMYGCPIVVSSPGNLSKLRGLVKVLNDEGVDRLVLDPGTYVGEGLAYTVNSFTLLRWLACRQGDRLSGYPLLAIPAVVWADEGFRGKPEEASWMEATVTAMMIARYADIAIIHGVEVWQLLPNLILRENLYTDPVKPVSVEPGLREFGSPDDRSPLLVTTNFALTYFTVSSDIESAKLNCYLLVVDTEGLSVESSVAGRKLTAEKIAEAMKEYRVAEKVSHRKVVIPGLAARLKGELEDLTGWEVLVGPRDSSDIPSFLAKYWRI
ncbi:MAG: acetyl-CoA decarbonylase/synthase complex subunit gamma [Nitrososphaerota archaeon]|nr:acetyl-CoA decarbonylase/synthase complex subunit gamma [Candidatus Bathyarchaeota archaeon]MDW8061724.1 acetyl-CoA decarbonylase/synthase complex subunit gamma [Nitrososphaerota archaeon]